MAKKIQIELYHDKLASKIYDLASPEQQKKKKVRDFIKERYEFFNENGQLLVGADLAYIKGSLGRIELTSEEETFIKKSQIRKNIRIAFSVLVAVSLVTLAIFIAHKIKNQKQDIELTKEELRIKSNLNEQIAQAFEISKTDRTFAYYLSKGILNHEHAPKITKNLYLDLINNYNLFPFYTRSITANKGGHIISMDAVSRDKTTLILTVGRNLKEVSVWNKGGDKITSLPHDKTISCAKFSSNGKEVIAGDASGNILIWNIEKDTATPFKLNLENSAISSIEVFQNRIYASGKKGVNLIVNKKNKGIICDNNNALIASSTSLNQIVITNDTKSFSRYEIDGSQIDSIPFLSNESIKSIAFSPKGTKILIGTGTGKVLLYDLLDSTSVPQPFFCHSSPVTSISFSNNENSFLTSSLDKTVVLWDFESKKIKELKGHSDGVYSAHFINNDEQIITSGEDGTIKFWNLTPIEKTFAGNVGNKISSIAILKEEGNDEYNILVGGARGKYGCLFLLDDKLNLLKGKKLSYKKSTINSTATTKNGRYIVAGADNWETIVWDKLSEYRSPKVLGGYRSIGSVNCVAISNNDQLLLAGGKGDPKSQTPPLPVASAKFDNITKAKDNLWETKYEFNSNIRSLAFSADDKLILVGGDDNLAILLNVDNQKRDTLGLHTDFVSTVAFSSDGTKALTGSWDNTAILWDISTGSPKLIHQYKGHTSDINSAKFSPDNKLVLTASSDNSVKLWSTTAPYDEKVCLISHRSSIYDAAFSPDGKHIITGGKDGTVRLWRTDNFEKIISERTAKFKPDSLEVLINRFTKN
jgi:WD40 repeat protein